MCDWLLKLELTLLCEMYIQFKINIQYMQKTKKQTE